MITLHEEIVAYIGCFYMENRNSSRFIVILLRSDIEPDGSVIFLLAEVILYSPNNWAKPNSTGASQYHCEAIELAARRI